MGFRSNITLTDAATVPVDHVFSPTQSSEGLIKWQDRTNPISIGQNRLTLVQRMATKQVRTNKLSYKLEFPVLEQTSPSTSTGIQPAPTVAFTALGIIELVLPDRMDLQNRKDLLSMLRDLIDEAIVTAQVHDYDFTY